MDLSLPKFELHTSPNGEHHCRKRSLKRWSFRVISSNGETQFEATDFEADVTLERLSLLALVRGLEWLDQPSQIVLISPSRSVARGLRYGLDMWRSCGWRWERFGQMVPIRNGDLWQRIDAALAFHQLRCQPRRVDRSHQGLHGPHFLRSIRKRRKKNLEAV